MSRKVVDSNFFTELDNLCARYGVSFDHDFDNYGQMIFFTSLRRKDGDVFEGHGA